MEYTGVRESELKRLGVIWCNKNLKHKWIFNHKVLDRFQQHKMEGFTTVLVSGSMGYCLEPLKTFLDADFAIWTELEVCNGVLTGNLLHEPTIGEGKARRIINFLNKNSSDCDLLNSYAYGDHASDIPMLNLVGNPYLVVNGAPKKYL